MENDYLKKNKGFSLIEIMVSLAVFSIVVLVAAGALLSIIDGARKTQALKSVINNLNFAMEDISRNLRVGTVYHCNEDNLPRDKALSCLNGASSIVFKTYKNEQATYRFKDGHIELDNGINSIPITAPEVVITNAKFIVTGTDANDNKQPKIFMTIQGYAGVKLRDQTNFNLQTTITQRILDF